MVIALLPDPMVTSSRSAIVRSVLPSVSAVLPTEILFPALTVNVFPALIGSTVVVSVASPVESVTVFVPRFHPSCKAAISLSLELIASVLRLTV